MTSVTYAQLKGVTENGDEILLYNDNTWQYINQEIIKEIEIATNEKVFVKGANAKFSVKSKTTPFSVWINPKKWKFTNKTDNEASEFEFNLKNEDLYGMMITERSEIPLESLGQVAYDNAKDVAPDVRIVNNEYRSVNGIKVLMMEMSGSTNGYKFTYVGYYFSNEKGSVQLVLYTGTNMRDEYYDEIELFLNGFVVL